MRTALVLIVGCSLISCGRSEAAKKPLNEQERIERWYEEWSARQPRPTAQTVDHIETLLTRISCIGDLNRWSRSYAYDMLPEKTVDQGIVDFHLEEAGTPGVKAGRQITAPDAWVNLDDRQIKEAGGDYDVKEDRIRIAACGNNVGPPGAGSINNMNSYFDELKRRRKAHGTASPLVPHEPKLVALQPGNPSNADKSVLRHAAEQCHLHPGALSFIQYDVPSEPVIRTTRAFGDTDAQLDCAIAHLPPEFNARFGLQFEAPK